MSDKAATARLGSDGLPATHVELLSDAIEAIPDPAALFTRDGSLVAANTRFHERFGWAPEDEVASPAPARWFANPEADVPRFQALLDGAGAPKRPVKLRSVTLRVATGSEMLTEVHARSLHHGQGDPLVIVVLKPTVSDDEPPDETLAVLERHRQWLETSTDMIHCLDTRARLLFVNKAWEAHTGFSDEEVIGTDGIDLILPEFRKGARAVIARLLEGGTVENHHFRSKTKDGRVIDILANFRPIFDAAGNVVQILGAGRDITELNRAQEALRESQERFQTIFEYAPDAYYLSDLKGRFVDGNRAAERIIGYQREELIGRSFLKLNLLSAAQMPRAAAALAKNALGKPTGPEEFVLTRRDGTDVTVEVSTYPVTIQGRVLVLGIARDVTERKRVQQELRESELKYRDLHETSRDGCAATDLEGRIIECNRAFREMLGYTFDELRGLTYNEITPRKWHKREGAIVNGQVFKRGYSELYEKEYIRKDGTIFPIEIRVYLKRDGAGAPAGLWAIVRDISERKRVEEALRESKERFKTIFDQAHEGIAYLGITGKILEANREAVNLFGGSREEIIGKHFADLGVLRLRDVPHLMVRFKEMLGGHLQPVNLWIKNRRGREIFLECSASLIKKDRRPVGLVIMARDATEHKRAEEALLGEKAFSDSVINSLPGVFYMFDEAGSFVRWNQNLEDVTEYSTAEMATIHAVDLFKESDRELIGKRIAQVFADGAAAAEADLVSKSGRKTPYLLTGVKVDRDGRAYLIGVGVDITERKRAEETLEKLNRDLQTVVTELERSNQELRDFAHVAAHDLKAPLRGIGLLADWISEDGSDRLDERGQENLALLRQRVDRMTQLINGILHYSEIGYGGRQSVEVDADALAREVIEQLAAPEHVDIRIENTLPRVACDPTRLTQVFQNLIGNAVKYVDKPCGRIRLAAVDQGSHWVFRIADNGPGIEEQHFERIFKMFQTLSPANCRESTGLGLAVVRKIVEMHRGKVWVDSEPGAGSTLFFTLPKSPQGRALPAPHSD
jgi:PAS domain S-box-containing protein